jgi:hypothetical protein
LRGVRAVDVSPQPGYVCALGDALDEDGKVAGIDRGDDEQQLDGSSVTGCLAVEFPNPIDQAVIRAKPTPLGCFTACSSTNCGTGHDGIVFIGASPTTLRKHVSVSLVSLELTDYTIELGAMPDVRVVALCRTGWGDSRDDLAVDVIRGRCR